MRGVPPVIIDDGLANRLFANENPIGQLLQYGADSGSVGGADAKPMVIVGVAPGVKHDLFENRPEPHIYVPAGGEEATRLFVYARAAAPHDATALSRPSATNCERSTRTCRSCS